METTRILIACHNCALAGYGRHVFFSGSHQNSPTERQQSSESESDEPLYSRVYDVGNDWTSPATLFVKAALF